MRNEGWDKNHETIGGRWLLAQPLGNVSFFLFSSSAFLVGFFCLVGLFCRVFCFFKFVALFFLLPPPNHVQKAILCKTIFVQAFGNPTDGLFNAQQCQSASFQEMIISILLGTCSERKPLFTKGKGLLSSSGSSESNKRCF